MRKLVWGTIVAGAVLTGCQKQARVTHPEVTDRNLVRADNPEVSRVIGGPEAQFAVMGNQAVHKGVLKGTLVSGTSSDGILKIEQSLLDEGIETQKWGGKIVADLELPPPSLLNPAPFKFEQTPAPPLKSLQIGIPMDNLKKQALFGGVITSVSDGASLRRGLLKLSEFPPTDVTLEPVKFKDGSLAIGLLGCAEKCDSPTQAVRKPVVALPVVALDEANKKIIVELSPLGEGLDFTQMVDRTGMQTESIPNFSRAIAADYSQNTLVFDIESTRTPITKMMGGQEPDLKVTTRWYLRLTDGLLNPQFKPRETRKEVGFFKTTRATSEMVTRFDLDNPNSPSTVKYYVKNVPKEYQAAFAAAFEEWNDTFVEILGRKVLVYEFVDAQDPRSALLVTGDVRYNLVEWDTNNHAPYGGLGPSSASQTTGQVQSANILIQGPDIDRMYKRWFGINGKPNEALEKSGTSEVGEEALVELVKEVKARAREEAALPKLQVRLGRGFEFTIHSQRPELEDPAMKRMDFIETPAGYSFEKYMFGYFKEMVAHELGHNLGLRHNFRGNLGAKEEGGQKVVSRSIMEYLGRGHRHLNRIGEYDRMAISYGYKGLVPKYSDWFCTDEDVGSSKSPDLSAECSKDDATSDPYSEFERTLGRALNLIVAPNSPSAPTFMAGELEDELGSSVTGLLRYAASAPATGSRWTNFTAVGRPNSGTEIQGFVMKRLAEQVCDPGLQKAAEAKIESAAREKAVKNIVALKSGVEKLAKSYKLMAETAQFCSSAQ